MTAPAWYRRDEGIALIASMSVIAIAAIASLTMLAYTLRETKLSAADRARAVSVSSAEGQIDVALAQMQKGGASTLPCGNSGDPGYLATAAPAPKTGTVPVTLKTTVTYYHNGAEVPCSSVRTGSTISEAALRTTGTVAGRPRTTETLVRLTPAAVSNGLDKAIFGNAGISLSNNGEVFGQNGKPDADIYTNGDFGCQNNQHYHGSIFAQGKITLAGTCTVDVDVHAGTYLSADNSGVSIGGRAMVHNGTAYAIKNITVGQFVWSKTHAGEFCSKQASKCRTGNATTPVPPVPSQTFPVINWNPTTRAEWAAGGFTNVVDGSNTPSVDNCTLSGEANGPGNWILSNAGTAGRGKTVLVTNCQVVLQKSAADITLSEDLVVFAKGGISFRNSLKIASNNTTLRRLYLIQPYDAVAQPCTTDGITLDNLVRTESTVDDLLYSPCNVRKANNADHYGQIYAGGRAIIDNRLTMYYRPLPVFGVTGVTAPPQNYKLDIAYKREK